VKNTLEMEVMNMNYKLMVAVVGAVMTVGCGTEEMEAPEPASQEQGLSKAPSHCVAQAVAAEHGKDVPAVTAPSEAQCFETFAEAISHATKGAVQLDSQAAASELDPKQMLAYGVVGVEYDYFNLLGSTLTLASDITCAQGDIYFPSLPTAWDNRISSARLYDTSCRSYLHFTDPNFMGWYGNCGSACNLTGVLDNQTSSIYLSYW
jgi:hypothetical protein